MRLQCLFNETDYKSTMWGVNYDRLYSIKKKYDERGLFWVSPGIGADDFFVDAKTGRVCSSVNRGQDQSQSQILGLPPRFDNQNLKDFVPTQYNLGPASQEIADKGGPPTGE